MTQSKSRGRPGVSRRRFLKGSTLTVAAAGVVSAIPGLPSFVSELAPDGAAADGAASDLSGIEAGTVTDSIVVHLRDVQTGEMSVYLGEREIPFRNPAVASAIVRASR